MEYWIIYDLATGAELYSGSGMPGTAAYQQPPEGAGIVVVPQSVVAQQPRDLGPLKEALMIGVDNEAERARARFITALPGQVGAYWLKAERARAWLADNTSSTMMLATEAASRRMTVAALAAEVIANADAWEVVADAIEGLKGGAKLRIAEAATIGAIVEAAVIDWSGLHAPG